MRCQLPNRRHYARKGMAWGGMRTEHGSRSNLHSSYMDDEESSKNCQLDKANQASDASPERQKGGCADI